jgi:uncharacterized protein
VSTEPEVAAAIRAHIDAFNARDVDALMAGFTDDATWITGETAVRGRAELTTLFTEAITGLLPRLTLQHLITEGDRVACQFSETISYSGGERTYSIAAFYRLVDGRIASAKVYREGSAIIE